MNNIKKYLSAHFPRIYKHAYRIKNRFVLSTRSPDDIFRDYYEKNSWGDDQSLSGPGSRIERTASIRNALPALVKEYDCQTVLDIPCGDFNWMKLVAWDVDYTGADIVAALIKKNQEQHGNTRRRFVHLDLLHDPLPQVDLVICRDCLVHFSYSDIYRAFANLQASKTRYLLLTTNPSRSKNHNIATGEWRPVNFQIKPFCLPEPLLMIDDTYPIPEYLDKHLALWKIADLPREHR